MSLLPFYAFNMLVVLCLCRIGKLLNFIKNKYRVLAGNSRWCSPIGLTQSDLMSSLSHDTADWFSPVSVANELTAQYSNTWLLFAVAVSSALQKPSIFPSSTCIDLLRGDSCMLYGDYSYAVVGHQGQQGPLCWPYKKIKIV